MTFLSFCWDEMLRRQTTYLLLLFVLLSVKVTWVPTHPLLTILKQIYAHKSNKTYLDSGVRKIFLRKLIVVELLRYDCIVKLPTCFSKEEKEHLKHPSRNPNKCWHQGRNVNKTLSQGSSVSRYKIFEMVPFMWFLRKFLFSMYIWTLEAVKYYLFKQSRELSRKSYLLSNLCLKILLLMGSNKCEPRNLIPKLVCDMSIGYVYIG